MLNSEKPEFVELISQVLAFYRQDASRFTLTVWWEACKGSELEQIRRALTAHAMNTERGQFPPKPADFARELQGTTTDRAALAWGRVYRAMAGVGAYAEVDFGDAAIHAAIVDVGGWGHVCRYPTDEIQFLQKRFCDAFRAYTARGTPQDTPLTLQGQHGAENAAGGLKWDGQHAVRITNSTPKKIQ